MAAKIVVVSPELIWPVETDVLWFFPDGSEFLQYSPHFHMIKPSGFRQNLPLTRMFVVVLEGKFSVKDFWGKSIGRIHVTNQVWRYRRTQRLAKEAYAMTVPGGKAYERSCQAVNLLSDVIDTA